MSDIANRPNVSCVHTQCGTEDAPCRAPSVNSRPRLGEAYDSWGTVLKDMLREAPKTGLAILATLVIAIINAVAFIFVGMNSAAPLSGVPTRWFLEGVSEALLR